MAADDFNRADGALGSNWTAALKGAPVISGNKAVANAAANRVAAWAGTPAIGADQYTEVTWVNTASGGGPVCRYSNDGANDFYYLAFFTGTELYVDRVASSSYVPLGAYPISISLTAGDRLRLEVTGSGAANILTVKVNGATIGIRSDDPVSAGFFARYDTGVPGFEIYDTALGLDDWAAAEITSGMAASIPYHQYRQRRM